MMYTTRHLVAMFTIARQLANLFIYLFIYLFLFIC